MEEREIKNLEIVNGNILLDGEYIPCIKNFNIVSSKEKPRVVELTICMDVSIEPSETV
ncbi:MAG: hypothetical protein ACI4EY_12595 [Lachnospiraceae bacterium]